MRRVQSASGGSTVAGATLAAKRSVLHAAWVTVTHSVLEDGKKNTRWAQGVKTTAALTDGEIIQSLTCLLAGRYMQLAASLRSGGRPLTRQKRTRVSPLSPDLPQSISSHISKLTRPSK